MKRFTSHFFAILCTLIAFPVLLSAQVEEKPVQSNEDKDIFTIVENQPQFPGGDEARIKFMNQNVRYPKAALEQGIQGTVYVTFVVEKDGNISNIRVIRGVHESLDNEALRVVAMMPKWNPGTQKGKPVRVQYNVPLKFSLAKDSDKGKDKKKKKK